MIDKIFSFLWYVLSPFIAIIAYFDTTFLNKRERKNLLKVFFHCYLRKHEYKPSYYTPSHACLMHEKSAYCGTCYYGFNKNHHCSEKRILCVIPARYGSKGLLGKNTKELLGKPLIAYTIEQAKKSKYISRIIVSTDSLGVANIAKSHDIEVLARPEMLAGDNASIIDVLLHAINRLEERCLMFSYIIALQPTSPLRRVDDIDNSLDLLIDEPIDNIFSVTPSHHNPYFSMIKIVKSQPRLIRKGKFVNRQSCPSVYDINGAIYAWRTASLQKYKSIFCRKSRVYIMPKERSIDIDDEGDFKIAEALLKERYRCI